MSERLLKIISKEILVNVSETLVDKYQLDNAIWDFIRELNSINTNGCFTIEGKNRIINSVVKDSRTQEVRFEILADVTAAFLQETITLDDMSAFIGQLYRPLEDCTILSVAYNGLLPTYKDSILSTYGATFVQAIMLRTISTHMEKLTVPLLLKQQADQKALELSNKQREYISNLSTGDDEDDINQEH